MARLRATTSLSSPEPKPQLSEAKSPSDAPPWRVVAEEATKLLGVCSFLLGHLTAFLGTLSEARDRVAAGDTPPAHGAHVRGLAQPHA